VTPVLILLSRVSCRGQEVTSPRLRALLALLAADLRTGCSSARLVNALWPDQQPEKPVKALQVIVSRARAQLGADLITSTPTGYRLTLAEDQVDASAAVLHAAAGAREVSAGNPAAALEHALAGLALWENPEDDEDFDDPDDAVSALRAMRAPAHRSLIRTRALASARLAHSVETVGLLVDVVAEHPLDEELLLELLAAEAATTGPSTALVRYETYRRRLRSELGTDPGPALQASYQRLLQAAAPVIRTGVRHEPNPLLGRGDDLAAVAKLLHSSRVTSIVGPGGLGKTRLAQALARQAEQPVVHVVALAGAGTDQDVVTEVASILDVGEFRPTAPGHHGARSDTVATIVAALGPGPVLLVLDNCEQVIRGVADLVQALVASTQDLRILTTSRTPLGLSSESVYLLPELDLPTTVELFEQRAQAVRPNVDLPTEAVQQLCRHLDGLPLAVELAAARVRVMSVAEIGAHLQDRFTLLRGGRRDAPERHRTLEAVVDWSWNLLEPAGQSALRALSIFPDGFTADAAQHLLGDGDVLETVELLVDQSLLKLTETESGARFRMLETVREFSAAHRERAAETERATAGFLGWVVEFAIANHDGLFGTDPFTAARRIRAELDNLVQALRLGLARAEAPAVAASSAVLGSLWTFESNYPRMATLARETDGLLARFRPVPELVEVTRTALTLNTSSTFLLQGPRAVRSLVALRRLPPAPAGTLLRAIAELLRRMPRDEAALYQLCDSDQPLLAGMASGLATYLWESEGKRERALQAAERMLEVVDAHALPWASMLARSRISELCLQAERGEQARHHLLTALPIVERLGTWSDVVGIRWWIVLADLQTGALDEAQRWMDETQRLVEEPIVYLTYGLGVEAEIALARGDFEAGLRLWRDAVEQLDRATEPLAGGDDVGLNIWALEARSVAVIAHAQHGRLDLVAGIAADLPGRLTATLREPGTGAGLFLTEFPICGALVMALALVDLDRATRTGDDHARTVATTMIALAERFGVFRGFQPTMSSARARQAAETADPVAYSDAVSAYAELSRDDLRAVALAALEERGRP
jgi:predicted ATPase/DNA-binding SARP family transcriptional activator